MNDEKNVSLKEATAESTKVEENEAAQVSNFKEKKEEEISTAKKVQNFFITTLNGMAYGLFATLIIGTILQTIGNFFKDGAATNAFCDFMYSIISKPLTDGRMGIAVVLQNLTGAGIGVGIAIALKKKPLETIVLGAVGEITAALSLSTKFVTTLQVPGGAAFQIGDPLTIYLTVISVALLMKLVLVKKTPVDILIVPLFAIVTGLIIGALVRFPAIYVTYGVQFIVGWSTLRVPFVMGVLIAVLMGIALTAPISSAAIAAMVFATAPDGALSEGLLIASGAAVVGCYWYFNVTIQKYYEKACYLVTFNYGICNLRSYFYLLVKIRMHGFKCRYGYIWSSWPNWYIYYYG